MSKSSSDPIFAAIAKYRGSYEKHSAAIKAIDAYQSRHRKTFRTSDRRLRELERQQRSLCDANSRAIREFSTTRPTTLAGALAALHFAEKSTAAGDEFLHCHCGNRNNDTSYPVFLSTLRKALERLSV